MIEREKESKRETEREWEMEKRRERVEENGIKAERKSMREQERFHTNHFSGLCISLCCQRTSGKRKTSGGVMGI